MFGAILDFDLEFYHAKDSVCLLLKTLIVRFI